MNETDGRDDAVATSLPSESTGRRSSVDDNRLVVVSNRQPYSHARENGEITVDAPAGGLTAGLDPVMQDVGGTWIAWGDGDADREVVDEDDCVSAPPDDPSYTLKRLWLSDEDIQNYYLGFSNQVLWPICHATLSNVHEEESFWQHYRDVNERFADAVVERAGDSPVVWFQDYHFGLAPELTRQRLSEDATIMQFWHIPWPSWDTFRACPHGRDIVRGLLGNDMLGFHVPRYRKNFLECVDAAFETATVDHEAGTVTYDDHTTVVVEFPLGVPADDIEQRATSSESDAYWSEFEANHDLGETVAIGVDRLDYSKGIPERLRALERFWADNPEWQGELTYVQNSSESRSEIPEYEEIQETVATEVERINDRFGTDDWEPIVSFQEYLSQRELAGLYRHSDLALVSPIRDGMNLVAQEYVAAQVDNDGVLVLSDQAGADDVLDGAVTTTPQSTSSFASAIEAALDMPDGERRSRMASLREQVSANDLSTWMSLNLRAASLLRQEASTETGDLLVGGQS